jgi:F0F1-type ATP synthase gamma subunit
VLLRALVQAQILRALVRSNAAFYAAQMTAMDARREQLADMFEA